MKSDELAFRLGHEGVRKPHLIALAETVGIENADEKTMAELRKLLLDKTHRDGVLKNLSLIPQPEAPAGKVKTLQEALDKSTQVNRTLGLTFVALMFYILLIIGSTTDLQLFLPDSKVTLPILEVELPLLTFYSVTPWIIVIFHFNLLINLKFHMDKFRKWKEDGGSQADIRLLDPFLVHFVEGISAGGFLRLILSMVIYLSVFIFPLLNVVLMLWRFAGYHSFAISTGQFGAVVVELVMVLWFYGMVMGGLGAAKRLFFVRLGKAARWGSSYGLGGLGLCVWLLMVYLELQMHYPERFSFVGRRYIPKIDLTNEIESVSEVEDSYVQYYLRDSSDVNWAKRNALLNFGQRINLRERDLRYALLNGIHLEGANLQSSHLEFASMVGANLSQANLTDANLSSSNLRLAFLDHSILTRTMLYGTNLEAAVLRNSSMGNAKMGKSNGKDRSKTRLNLRYAHLDGLMLEGAVLSGALLEKAHLENCILDFADLSQVHAYGAVFTNASLCQANFEKADLRATNLVGVRVEHANLCNANLDMAYMLNATFDKSDFENASLYRSTFIQSSFSDARFVNAILMRYQGKNTNFTLATFKNSTLSLANFSFCDFSGASFDYTLLDGSRFENCILETADLDNSIFGSETKAINKQMFKNDTLRWSQLSNDTIYVQWDAKCYGDSIITFFESLGATVIR